MTRSAGSGVFEEGEEREEEAMAKKHRRLSSPRKRCSRGRRGSEVKEREGEGKGKRERERERERERRTGRRKEAAAGTSSMQ